MEDLKHKRLIVSFLWLDWLLVLFFIFLFIATFTVAMNVTGASLINRIYSGVIMGSVSFFFALVFYLNSIIIRLMMKNLKEKCHEIDNKATELKIKERNLENKEEEDTDGSN